eukprot:756393-Hanusia_phi.AAC.1
MGGEGGGPTEGRGAAGGDRGLAWEYRKAVQDKLFSLSLSLLDFVLADFYPGETGFHVVSKFPKFRTIRKCMPGTDRLSQSLIGT